MRYYKYQILFDVKKMFQGSRYFVYKITKVFKHPIVFNCKMTYILTPNYLTCVWITKLFQVLFVYFGSQFYIFVYTIANIYKLYTYWSRKTSIFLVLRYFKSHFICFNYQTINSFDVTSQNYFKFWLLSFVQRFHW